MSLRKEKLLELSAHIRAVQLWFHGAHHLTKGAGFSGDHALLYAEIYEAAEEQFDGYVERNLGLSNDEAVADPAILTALAANYVAEMPRLAEQSADAIAAGGLLIMRAHITTLDSFYNVLKEAGEMTLGLDDMVMANANACERFVYLLQQRAKHSSASVV